MPRNHDHLALQKTSVISKKKSSDYEWLFGCTHQREKYIL